MIFGVGLLVMAILFLVKAVQEFQGRTTNEQEPSKGLAIGYLIGGFISFVMGSYLLLVTLVKISS